MSDEEANNHERGQNSPSQNEPQRRNESDSEIEQQKGHNEDNGGSGHNEQTNQQDSTHDNTDEQHNQQDSTHDNTDEQHNQEDSTHDNTDEQHNQQDNTHPNNDEQSNQQNNTHDNNDEQYNQQQHNHQDSAHDSTRAQQNIDGDSYNQRAAGGGAGRYRSPPGSSASEGSGPVESPPPLDDLYPDMQLLVSPLEKKYSCVSCKKLLQQPVQIKACGHHMCYPCYEEVWSGETPQCPDDQMDLGDKFPVIDKAFRDEVEQLEVRCQNHAQDCRWEGTIQDFLNHVELCEYIKIPCEYDCGAVVLKFLKDEHVVRVCPRHFIKCPYCHDVILREDKRAHYHECDKLPIPCPNKCDKKTVPKSKLDKHLENECARSKVVCKYNNVGCSHESLRDKMEQHCSTEVAIHLQMLLDLDLNHSASLKDIMNHIEAHEFAIRERDIPRICELEKMTRTQFIWKIDKFQEKMEEAKHGNNETLFNPPFTTSKHGYRLSASVCLNGDGKGKGSHMSVFLSVLQGPFDTLLQWPFECRVSFTLLDQNPDPVQRKHIKFSIKPNPCPENEPFLGRPKTEKNASFGCATFAKHEELASRNYTDNNTLFLKIAVDWKCDVVPEP